MSAEQRGEFALIQQYFASGFPSHTNTRLGVGDDCSVITLPHGFQLAQSIDTQVADVHFPAAAPADLIAQRALRCAVSDLAAMGAEPQGFHLALTLPDADPQWLQLFSEGLKAAASACQIDLLGGDTTSGKTRVITIAVQGIVPADQALTRSGAQAGDDIWVSGVIGASALALPRVLKNPAENSPTTKAYYFPEPQIKAGMALRTLASSCMDISDGLIQDAGHIARNSALSLEIDGDRIPLPETATAEDFHTCISGGDDYQLLFTAAASQRETLLALSDQFPQLTRIGTVVALNADKPVRLLVSGEEQPLHRTGYQHF